MPAKEDTSDEYLSDNSDDTHEKHNRLAPPHAPKQVKSDCSQGAFHAIATGDWRFQMPVQFSNFVAKPPLSEWPPSDWRANNNSLGSWDKYIGQPPSEIPQHLAATTYDNSSLTMLTAQQPGIEDKIHPNGFSSPKEDGRKSSEHTNSYDVSASQSPSNDAQSEGTVDEQIDVECMTQTEEMETDDKDVTIKDEPAETIEVKTPVPMLPAPIAIIPVQNGGTPKMPTMEETQRLLALSQSQFQEVIAEAAKIKKASAESSFGFMRSGSSAFSNIEPKAEVRSPSVISDSHASTIITSPTLSTPPASASFCRPPGLGPVAVSAAQQNGSMFVCPVCGFTCPSKFHFNSHMNTHGDHQCSMCDYTSRTEGRLKKHMRDSHTVEEQLRVGLELEPAKEAAGSSPKTDVFSSPTKENSASSPILETFNLSTTMASLLDSTNSAIAAISSTDQPSSLPSSINLDVSSTPTLLSTLAQGTISSSALDQIKAFAENTNLLPENGISLVSALRDVSQAIKGEPASSPEKQSNSETRKTSSGKTKILKCKQCGHHSMSKDEQWAHARTHIPAEKQLNCQHCNFVTEYKHHLEYHYRNHIGSKPFQCKKCTYTCVNKSMLNSHMKSHTNHYQFKCMDCSYATKYCHSLKLHLKKYGHRRVPEGLEVNGEISPSQACTERSLNFSPTIIKQEIKTEGADPVTPIAQPFAFNPLVASQSLNFANQMLLNKNFDVGLMAANLRNATMQSFKCPVCDVVCSSHEEQMRHSMSHILSSTSVPTTIANLYSSLNLPTLGHLKPKAEVVQEDMEVEVKIEDDIEDSQCGEEEMDQSSDLAVSPTGSAQTISSTEEETKKCKPLTLEQLTQHLRGNSPMSNDSAVVKDEESLSEDTPHSPCDTTSVSSPPHTQVPIAAPIPLLPPQDASVLQALLQHATMAYNMANRGAQFPCNQCTASFPTQAALTAHIHTHSYENPFRCGKCQFQAPDSLTFAIHLFQSRHG
ncbi:unnamed protein product [Caenorhabditis sp. 36 PRJEB53466]|nr:unnamed protein product [Caenorhabditis sp. 36 PRJEB53466]